MKDDRTRSLNYEIQIDAPPEAVWRALTDPRELVNWFPIEAEVTPGEGGVVRYIWGELSGDCPILAWEPNRHLRTGWMASPEQDERAARVAVDYHIEAHGGSTVLRVVHSGFSVGDQWDDEYDGTRRGWGFELGSLRHYLEKHRGKKRRMAWSRCDIAESNERAWQRLLEAPQFLRDGKLAGLKPGDRYAVTVADGERLEGRVLRFDPPHQFGGTVENLDDALFRFAVETCFGRPEVHVWLASWTLSEERIKQIETQWNALLANVFPQAA